MFVSITQCGRHDRFVFNGSSSVSIGIASGDSQRLKNIDDRVTYITLDVDDAFDLYGFLQSKKMVSGIPAVLAYAKGNTNYASDFAVASCKATEINAFFDQVETKLKDL